jgi:hypothetical protein
MSFIGTGLREIGLKVRRQRARMALRHHRRVLQRAEIALGREGVEQAGNFPELRNEIVALKKLEQEQKEVAARIAQIEEASRQLDAERERNLDAQNAAIGELEQKKKPLLQTRSEAKAAADLCDGELSSVEKRLHANDAADVELLRKLSELHAATPPPDDLDAQSAAISAQRVRLPDERALIMQARLGAADACRNAKQKLDAVDGQIDALDKQIASVRAEFEAKARALNETSRTQQEALKQARGQHQTVEERKNPAYLNIGRHLATQGIAPGNAPHLLSDVQRHRETHDKHVQHTAELAVLSSQIDKQELRKFYFSVVSILVLLAIVVPLVFKTPPKREWLPQETEAILSLNLDQFDRDDLPKRWRKEQPDEWARVWSGLAGGAAQTAALNINRDAIRITRAMTTDTGAAREFVLIESRTDLSPLIRALSRDESYTRHVVQGLPVWQRPGLSIARVGPKTIAIGAETEVEELVRVRLGIRPDLKTSGQLWDRFQALDQSSALRLISRDPASLTHAIHPIFSSELLGAADVLGVALTLQNPVRARLLLKAKTSDEAQQLSRKLRDDPQRWLHIADSTLMLSTQRPDVHVQGTNVEARFDIPENSARLVLQRIAKSDAAQQVAER